MPRHFNLPQLEIVPPCLGAQAILGKAYDACESFHIVFRTLREGAGAGTTTDEQQDTLRAMLVFACAGLDSAIKQLVRDALQSVIDMDDGAQTNLTKSIQRRLADLEKSKELLAAVLTAPNPRRALMQRQMDDLLADSLQSREQLSKVAAAFNITTTDIPGFASLQQAFQARNQIVHEMDIDFNGNRGRRQRKQADMESQTAIVLGVATSFLKKVDEKLR